MEKGWIVIYDDGSYAMESESEWKSIKKTNIKTLRLKWHNKIWDITGKKNYVQFKTSSIGIGENNPTLHSRCIGYYDGEGNKVIYRVDENTGIMRIEVVSCGRTNSNYISGDK
jgi:hypothetical protein